MLKKNLSKVVSLMLSVVLTFMVLTTVPTVKTSALTMTYTPSSGYKNSKYYTQLLDVELTGDQAIDIVNIAESQLGYHEGNSESQFNGYNTSGSLDYTEYGRWIGISNVAWCATFISWCAEQAGIPTSSIAKQTWASGLKATSTTGHFGNAFKSFNSYTPKSGDIVYFDTNNDGVTNHVELVVSVDDNYITTIGGNASDCVKYHYISRKTNGSIDFRILGYESPNYTILYSEPPTDVSLTLSGDWYTEDDSIYFYSNANNATYCTLNIAQDGETLYTFPTSGNSMLSGGVLSIGEYDVWVTASNPKGSTDSEVVKLSILGIPTYSKVTCGNSYGYGENIKIAVTSTNATGHALYIENADGKIVRGVYCEDGTFEMPASNLSAGVYYAYFDVYNARASVRTDKVKFTIYDKAPTVSNLSIDKTLYSLNDPITLNFSSDCNVNYCIKILKENGSIYYMGSTEANTYTTTLPVGKYSIIVNAYNPLGNVDSKTININVVTTAGDTNGDNVLNYLDVVTLKKYLLGINTVQPYADFNEDGEVNIMDYILLMSMLESK